MIYIILGVSGVGKTTIGKALAKQLHIPFYDADDFHPTSNVEKMKNGVPLNDEDRWPWLKELAQYIIKWNRCEGAVLACSALKEEYRKTLEVIDENKLTFIFLNTDFSVILKRLKNRTDHFMGAEMLTSQFEALEIPQRGIFIDVNKKKEAVLAEIIEQLYEKNP